MSTTFDVRRWATQAGIQTAGGFAVIAECVTMDELQRFAEIAIASAGIDAADMAAAAASGFRDGAASAMAGEPMAWMTFTEEGDPDMVFLDRLEACQYCEDDDPPKPLYLAAPPTAQAGGWISVQDELPKCSKKPDSFGVEVLIWPPHEDGSRTAFYGRRQSREPNFYKYGALLGHVEFWRYPPPPPTSAEGVEHG